MCCFHHCYLHDACTFHNYLKFFYLSLFKINHINLQELPHEEKFSPCGSSYLYLCLLFFIIQAEFGKNIKYDTNNHTADNGKTHTFKLNRTDIYSRAAETANHGNGS